MARSFQSAMERLSWVNAKRTFHHLFTSDAAFPHHRKKTLYMNCVTFAMRFLQLCGGSQKLSAMIWVHNLFIAILFHLFAFRLHKKWNRHHCRNLMYVPSCLVAECTSMVTVDGKWWTLHAQVMFCGWCTTKAFANVKKKHPIRWWRRSYLLTLPCSNLICWQLYV